MVGRPLESYTRFIAALVIYPTYLKVPSLEGNMSLNLLGNLTCGYHDYT